MSREQRVLLLAILPFGLLGAAMVFLFPDSYQQDGGNHFLHARWVWTDPAFLVGVWSRPLFVFSYAIPALFGYAAAKLFTVALTLATAWQTARLAARLGIDRPALAAPLLLVQPVVLLLFHETMTEPLFAFVLIIALRLHHEDRPGAAALLASFLGLARPEGAFIALIWAVALIRTRRWRLLPLLGVGGATWWLASLVVTGDPLYIAHSWPPDWTLAGATYGRGGPFDYLKLLGTIVGWVHVPALAVGLVAIFQSRKFGLGVAAFLSVWIGHSVLRTFGMFGSAGYDRYFVCVAPVSALLLLEGWNRLFARVPRLPPAAVMAPVLLGSAIFGFLYVDQQPWSRDARGIDAAARWLAAHPVAYPRAIWSQAYMAIRLGAPCPHEKPLSSDREGNLELLRRQPPGTLIFWDGDTGPAWYSLRAEDIETAGYQRIWSGAFMLLGRVRRDNSRDQDFALLVKRG